MARHGVARKHADDQPGDRMGAEPPRHRAVEVSDKANGALAAVAPVMIVTILTILMLQSRPPYPNQMPTFR